MVGAAEPKLYPGNEAKAYGVVKDAPRLANGSVTVKTIFHVVSDHALSSKETTRYETLIGNQMTVLNDSYAARTAADAADTPFRFGPGHDHLHGRQSLLDGPSRARWSGT